MARCANAYNSATNTVGRKLTTFHLDLRLREEIQGWCYNSSQELETGALTDPKCESIITFLSL